MQKLGEIQLEKTVTLKVECNLNDQIVVKNFQIIMDCLKDLSAGQNDLAGRLTKITDRVSSLEKQNSNNSNKQSQAASKQQQIGGPQSASSGLTESEKQNLLNLIKQLEKRTTENQKNIMGNTSDINLINKQIQDLKEALAKIKLTSDNIGVVPTGKDNTALNQESINNINKEMQSNKQLINKTNEELDKLRKELASMKEKLNRLLEDQKKDTKNTQSNNDKSKESEGGQDLNKAELNQLREKIAILNKKTNGLELLTEELKNETASLGEGQESLENNFNNLNKQLNDLKEKLSNLLKNSKNSSDKSTSNITDLDQLKKIKNQIKDLRSEIEDLKRENNSHSKTSIDDEKKNKFDRGNFTQVKFKDDSLKDLIARIEYLEKMLGSKNSIGEDKLPLIKRKVKQRDTTINDKSTSKKDVSEIKGELQAWLNNYLMEMKSRDNFDDIELKLQEIKNSLNKKADQEGLRKGLTFLQSKINQLYLFLTEPDGDDAMIVRKGFNCLSCSKKVEKLRGKLGPHINWNNMTATNYSPPKVGYSRHMGENSGEKQEDQ